MLGQCVCLCLCLSTWLTVPGMCVLAVLWPLGPVVVVLRIFFFLRSSSRCSFCLFCTSISSEIKLFFTCSTKGDLIYVGFWDVYLTLLTHAPPDPFLSTVKNTLNKLHCNKWSCQRFTDPSRGLWESCSAAVCSHCIADVQTALFSTLKSFFTVKHYCTLWILLTICLLLSKRCSSAHHKTHCGEIKILSTSFS